MIGDGIGNLIGMRGAATTRIRARRAIAAVLLTSVLGVGTVAGVSTSPALAASSSDLRAKASRIADQIDRIEHEFEKLAESFNEASAESDALDVELTASAARVQQIEGDLGGIRIALRDFAVRMFASGGELGGLGELLGGSTALTDTVIRDQYASLALTSGQQASNDLESTLNELSAAKRKLERQKNAKAKLLKTLDSRKAAAEAKQAQLLKLQNQTNADLKQALADEQARREARARQRAEAAANSRPRNNGGNTGGGRGGNTGGGRGGNSGGGGSSNGGGNSGGGGSSNGGGNSGGGRDVPPPSPGASGAVAAAKSQIGVPYVAFMARPGVGFDCSGLTAWAWSRAGVRLPHQSRLQYAVTRHIDPADAQPGDLLFFYRPITHVAMYLGDGLMIDASAPGKPIRIHGFKWSSVSGVGRPG